MDFLSENLQEIRNAIYLKSNEPNEKTAVASTYNATTNRITFIAKPHYFTIRVDTDMYYVIDSSNPTTDLGAAGSRHFIAAGERLAFGPFQTPLTTLDFLTISGTGKVYVSSYVITS
jgi:hypothetical protein